MARTTQASQNQSGEPSNVTPPEVDPIEAIDVFIRRMEQVLNRADRVVRNETPVRQTGDKLLKRFRDLQPENFTGLAEA